MARFSEGDWAFFVPSAGEGGRMAIAPGEQADNRTWLGAYVDQTLLHHVDGLVAQIGTTRSHVLRTVLRHTDVDRLLDDLRREAGGGASPPREPGAAA